MLVYNSSHLVAFGQEQSLTLFNVTPEDSGSYECSVNAHIGGRNLNIRVELAVNGESARISSRFSKKVRVRFQLRRPRKQNFNRVNLSMTRLADLF